MINVFLIPVRSELGRLLRGVLGRIPDAGRQVHADCCDWLRSAGYTLRSLDALPVESTDELIATAS